MAIPSPTRPTRNSTITETSVTYVSSQITVKVFRIEATATIRGIATAGSVPKTNNRMTSAPSPPTAVSTRMLGPPPPPLPAAC